MVSQLRIYVINRGMMVSWLKLFEEHIRPLSGKLGMPVESAWVNIEDAARPGHPRVPLADQTEFIWVRSFESAEEIPEKEAAYFASPECKALGDLPLNHVAKSEVRVIEPVLTAEPVS